MLSRQLNAWLRKPSGDIGRIYLVPMWILVKNVTGPMIGQCMFQDDEMI